MRTRKLDRRTILRGLGVAVALPPLEAMETTIEGRGLFVGEAGAQTRPARLVTWAWSCGVNPAQFHPKDDGPGYTPTPNLMPLEPVREHVLVVTGLQNEAQSPKNGGKGDGAHDRGLAALMTGYPGNGRFATAPSIDHIAAQQLGKSSRIRLLSIAVEPPKAGSPQFNHISYAGVNQPIAAERDPKALFSRLFTSEPADPEVARRIAAERRSVLDVVLADFKQLERRVGGIDRARLDQHLASIRELERRLQSTPAGGAQCSGAKDPGALTAPGPEKAKAMMDLLVMALKCDITRAGSFLMQNAGGGWSGLHGTSHNDPARHATMVTPLIELYAYLVKALAAVPEGGGSLLDSTLVVASTEVPDGARHSSGLTPFLLAGHAGGLKGGRLLRMNRSHTALLGAVLNQVGVATSQLGFDGSAPASLS